MTSHNALFKAGMIYPLLALDCRSPASPRSVLLMAVRRWDSGRYHPTCRGAI